jgi:hypothetical protein
VPDNADSSTDESVKHTPTDWERQQRLVAAALAYLHPETTRDFWLRVGMGVHLASGGSESAFRLWHTWSSGLLTGKMPVNYVSETDCRTRWRSFGRQRKNPVTLGTMFAMAKAAGFVFPEHRLRISRGQNWPAPLANEAFQGLFGDIVRAIESDTEADQAALLLQAITAFGSLVGRSPYYKVEGDSHFGNLFVVLVGETAKARKGTSWGRIRELFSEVQGWTGQVNPLSSGEGLIAAFARLEADGLEKRILAVEPEFSQVLRQGARAGNILSPTIRSAWDTGNLMTLTKKNPQQVEGAHLSIIAHITEAELRTELTETDSANGFANRFIYQSLRRSKRLPFGGDAMPESVRNDLVARIARAVKHARSLQRVEMGQDARALWIEQYKELSEGHDGLVGAVTARAEAQVVRLALNYGLADESDVVEACHLQAAFALCRRAEESARYIFGSALGNSVADDLLRALRASGPTGMTRTAIRDYFSHHAKAGQVNAALDLLERQRLAICIEQPSEGGRPAELWIAIEHATEATKATEVMKKADGLSSHKSLKSQPRKVIRVVKRRDK